MKWFEIALVVLTLGSGLVLLLDKLFMARRRATKGGLLDSEEPALVDYSRAFFPVLAVVLILRSFIAEPYKIPSSSMMPNLLIGDFILVNKFAYGIRLPITNTKVIPTGEPSRGDVVVFQFPGHPDMPGDPQRGENFIKRVVGLPGDRIGFHGDTLSINGQPLAYEVKGEYVGKGRGAEMNGATLLSEALP
ncbi:MAG: signal peptidase I, partial [Stenotrophomonas nitritireducens]|nr:signal peptidase I [Stenotrophomonas nitritireducens]